MISWIQRTFQRHFRWVFFLVLAAMAIPLIVIFSPGASGSRAGNKLLERQFFSVNLENPEQRRRMETDGYLSATLGPEFAAYAAREGIQVYGLKRMAGLALADELHLPAPTADQVSRFVATLNAFQNEQGQFDQKRYVSFGDSLKAGGQFTVTDVNRVLRDDARLALLSKLVGGPGYVVPHDIREALSSSDANWTVQVATLDYATFAPDLNATEEALKKFHEENAFRYEVPARPRFSYVEFKGADFPPATRPTEAEARAYYNTNAASFPPPADPAKKDAATPPASPDENFQKVRAQVETAMISRASARLASKAANDLAVVLFERKQALAPNSPELAAFLASQHLAVTAVPPFAPATPPADRPWLGAYTEQIAHLTKDRFFSDALPTVDSFVILLWNEDLPAYKPLFSEVRERVAADYKEGEKRRLFSLRGNALRTQLQAAAKTPAGFAAAAAAEKLEVKTFANFSVVRQPPQDLPQEAHAALRGLEAGDVSAMTTPSGGKGFLVYVQEKKQPDLSPANPRYGELRKQLMQYTASEDQNAYLGELIARELKKTETAGRPTGG